MCTSLSDPLAQLSTDKIHSSRFSEVARTKTPGLPLKFPPCRSPSPPAKTIEANSGHPLASWLIVALWLSCAVFIVEKWKVPEALGAALSGEYNAEPGTFPWEAI